MTTLPRPILDVRGRMLRSLRSRLTRRLARRMHVTWVDARSASSCYSTSHTQRGSRVSISPNTRRPDPSGIDSNPSGGHRHDRRHISSHRWWCLSQRRVRGFLPQPNGARAVEHAATRTNSPTDASWADRASQPTPGTSDPLGSASAQRLIVRRVTLAGSGTRLMRPRYARLLRLLRHPVRRARTLSRVGGWRRSRAAAHQGPSSLRDATPALHPLG